MKEELEKIRNTEQTQALSLAPYANNIDGHVCVCPWCQKQIYNVQWFLMTAIGLAYNPTYLGNLTKANAAAWILYSNFNY